MNALSASLKALGDPVRLRLFSLLGKHEELCVCHLVGALKLPQSTISRHLSVLRHAGLVQTRREGKWMYYTLCGDVSAQMTVLLDALHVEYDEDVQALREQLSCALEK